MFARTKITFALAATALCLCGPVRADELTAAKPETISVAVTGEVTNKGRYTLPKGATFLDAVDAAGGLTIYATPNATRLIHNSQASIVDMRKLRRERSRGPVLDNGDQIQAATQYF